MKLTIWYLYHWLDLSDTFCGTHSGALVRSCTVYMLLKLTLPPPLTHPLTPPPPLLSLPHLLDLLMPEHSSRGTDSTSTGRIIPSTELSFKRIMFLVFLSPQTKFLHPSFFFVLYTPIWLWNIDSFSMHTYLHCNKATLICTKQRYLPIKIYYNILKIFTINQCCTRRIYYP